MSEIYRIIPAEDRAYEWAKAELTTNFKKPDHYRITHLDKLTINENCHVSIFHKEGASPDIWRVYWADTDSVKYSILVNYEELKSTYPDIVKRLEECGVEAYQTEMARKEKYERATGKRSDYTPLKRFKREDTNEEAE